MKASWTGPGRRPGIKFRQRVCHLPEKGECEKLDAAGAHLVPFFFRKEFLVLSVLLFSSRAAKPPLSSVTDSSPAVMCLPAEKNNTYTFVAAAHVFIFLASSIYSLYDHLLNWSFIRIMLF